MGGSGVPLVCLTSEVSQPKCTIQLTSSAWVSVRNLVEGIVVGWDGFWAFVVLECEIRVKEVSFGKGNVSCFLQVLIGRTIDKAGGLLSI